MLNKLFGVTEIRVSEYHKGKALDIALKKGLILLDSRIDNNSELVILTRKKESQRYIKLYRENGVEIVSVINHGERNRYMLKHRCGIIFGMIVLLLGIFYLSNLVWSIEITGNERLSENEVKELLTNVGFSEGVYIPSINYDSLHNKILRASSDIAWVSVNIRGNRAVVELTEAKLAEDESASKYCNIVAAQDGQIATVFVSNGKKCVSIGDVVKKGDILISGVSNSQSSGVRYENAAGIITAYVNKSLSVEASLTQESKEYDGRVFSEKHLKIFNNDITFFRKCNNCSEFCDTIVKKSNKLSLPIFFYTVEHHPWVTVNSEISVEEATSLALNELNERLGEISQNAEIVSKSVKTVVKDGKVNLICDLYCIENICQKVEFEVEN